MPTRRRAWRAVAVTLALAAAATVGGAGAATSGPGRKKKGSTHWSNRKAKSTHPTGLKKENVDALKNQVWERQKKNGFNRAMNDYMIDQNWINWELGSEEGKMRPHNWHQLPHEWAACAKRVDWDSRAMLHFWRLYCHTDGGGKYPLTEIEVPMTPPTPEQPAKEVPNPETMEITWKKVFYDKKADKDHQFACKLGHMTKIEGSKLNKRGNTMDFGKKLRKLYMWCPERTKYGIKGNVTVGGPFAPSDAGEEGEQLWGVKATLATRSFLNDHYEQLPPPLEQFDLVWTAGATKYEGAEYWTELRRKYWAAAVVDTIAAELVAAGPENVAPVTFADMACGAGWMGLTVAASIKGARIYFSDINENYLVRPKGLMQHNGLAERASYHVGDVFEAFQGVEAEVGGQVQFKHIFFFPPQSAEDLLRPNLAKDDETGEVDPHAEKVFDDRAGIKYVYGDDPYLLLDKFMEGFQDYLLPGGTAWIGVRKDRYDKWWKDFTALQQKEPRLKAFRWDARYMNANGRADEINEPSHVHLVAVTLEDTAPVDDEL